MRYRHRLTVQPREQYDGKAGQAEYRDRGAPIIVPGNLRPLSAEEIQLYGDRARETRKFFCRTWPGDLHSRITGPDGAWDQVSAEFFDYGTATQHVEVVVRRR